MAYVRTKRIKGIEYRYLVEGVREGGKVKQRVIAYLGQHQTVKAAYRYWSLTLQKAETTSERSEAKSMIKKLEPYL